MYPSRIGKAIRYVCVSISFNYSRFLRISPAQFDIKIRASRLRSDVSFLIFHLKTSSSSASAYGLQRFSVMSISFSISSKVLLDVPLSINLRSVICDHRRLMICNFVVMFLACTKHIVPNPTTAPARNVRITIPVVMLPPLQD